MSVTNTGTTKAGGVLQTALQNYGRSNIDNTIKRWCIVNIGATGAPTIAPTGTVFGIARSGTGAYNLTYPAHLAANTVALQVRVALSAATTVAQATVTAFAPTSGTASFVTALNAAATPVDPANGDILLIELTSDDLNS